MVGLWIEYPWIGVKTIGTSLQKIVMHPRASEVGKQCPQNNNVAQQIELFQCVEEILLRWLDALNHPSALPRTRLEHIVVESGKSQS